MIVNSRPRLNKQIPSKHLQKSQVRTTIQELIDKYEPGSGSADGLREKISCRADLATAAAAVSAAASGVGVFGCFLGGALMMTAGVGLGLAGVGMLAYSVSKLNGYINDGVEVEVAEWSRLKDAQPKTDEFFREMRSSDRYLIALNAGHGRITWDGPDAD